MSLLTTVTSKLRKDIVLQLPEPKTMESSLTFPFFSLTYNIQKSTWLFIKNVPRTPTCLPFPWPQFWSFNTHLDNSSNVLLDSLPPSLTPKSYLPSLMEPTKNWLAPPTSFYPNLSLPPEMMPDFLDSLIAGLITDPWVFVLNIKMEACCMYPCSHRSHISKHLHMLVSVPGITFHTSLHWLSGMGIPLCYPCPAPRTKGLGTSSGPPHPSTKNIQREESQYTTTPRHFNSSVLTTEGWRHPLLPCVGSLSTFKTSGTCGNRKVTMAGLQVRRNLLYPHPCLGPGDPCLTYV